VAGTSIILSINNFSGAEKREGHYTYIYPRVITFYYKRSYRGKN
jgi:hypothetical protein